MSISSYEHIHPDFRHIMGLPDKARIEFMDQPRWINYKAAQQIMGQMMTFVQQSKLPKRKRKRPSYPREVWKRGAYFPSRKK